MKKRLFTVLCAMALSFSLSTECFASISSSTKNVPKTCLSKSSLVDEINSEQNNDNLSEDVINASYEESNEKYPFKKLNKLSNEEIIELSTKISWKDIPDIFKYNEDTYEFYSNKNRVQAIIDGLYQKSCTFTATDDNGIDTLVEILRSGFYLGFYNDSLKYLKDRKFLDKCIPALIAMENNPNFKLGKEGQDKVVLAFGKLIGNASCNPEVVNKSVAILNQYYDEVNQYPKDKLKGDAVLKIMSQITYDIDQYCYDNNIRDGKNTPWTGKIDNFINTISKFASITQITDDNGWLINNGIYYTAKLAKYHSNPKILHKVLDNCLKTLPNTSEQYITTLDLLKSDFNSKDSNGNNIDVDKIIEDKKNAFLPKTYTFDDGKMVIKAGDKVSESKIQRLYWAAKEVKAQFHRIIGSDEPLETGAADDVLTMVIYNNPKEYKLNRLLYGYSVDNGGIYIENVGTFFTYERTPKDSIYSLEELFRHEFTHYLQGRYLVPGLFNQGDFYRGNNTRLTWFEEGSAEFFAGSTRTTVLPRKSMVSGIGQNEEERLNANSLFHSSYSDGWEFYTYGYTFTDYMYNNDHKLFKDLVDSMKSNDVNRYDSIIKRCSKDKNLNRQYQKHMNKLVDNYSNYTIPLVSDNYMKKYDSKNLQTVKKDIENAMGLNNSKIVKERSDYFNTYTLRGTYKLDSNNGEFNNWNKMNKKVNEALEKLNKLPWKGYKTVTGYFVNPRVSSDNKVEYDVVFHGLLHHNDNFIEEPTITLTAPTKGNAGEKIKFTSECSTDDSNFSYVWDFGDGNTSNEKNPTHIYKTSGNYSIELKVTDSKGFEIEKSSEINIFKILNGNPVRETEYNNGFENANEINLNDLVSGDLQGDDSQDTFSFEVTKPDDITITLENSSADKDNFNWLLFDAENTNDYLAFPKNKMNQLTKTITIDKPGKYYLVVYQSSKEKNNYKFLVEGSFVETPEVNEDKNTNETDENTNETTNTNHDNNKHEDSNETTNANHDNSKYKNINEEEYNDDFQCANNIFKNQIVSGNLDSSERGDTFSINALSAGTINVILENSNMDSSTINWLAYNSEDTDNYIGYASKNDGNKFSGSFKVNKPGKYYIVVYEANGNNSKYKLKIDGDIESSSKSDDKDIVKEEKNDDSFDSATKINTTATITDTLNNEDNKDIYYFNVDKTTNLNIKLKSLNKLGVAWQLFSEKDLNNYIAYGSKSDDSIVGTATVEPGKYYLLIYKYTQDNGAYTFTIK
ncbi:collagenase [Clostridium taeniosporum]|uniref:microbial collagenase n=1 Tax=Clostridium taeniosporum TaxID=394958 RepID=A0A1D7XJ60_9CLOT|nr:collagenase [Clostridium taeniosporum]AOR23362.1 peptidase M9 [Clostridium taeniosporum]